jgi:hypothetical protein
VTTKDTSMNQRNVRRAPIALLALALPFTALGTDA